MKNINIHRIIFSLTKHLNKNDKHNKKQVASVEYYLLLMFIKFSQLFE